MGLEGVEARVVEGLGGGALDGAVHPLCLTVGPRMVGFGQPVLDAVLVAAAVEDVAAEDGFHGGMAPAVLWQIGEGHAVVGEHGVDLVGEDLDHLAEEGGAVELGVGVEERDVGELGDPVDGEEHEELAFGKAQFADVGVDVADGGIGEATALGGLVLVLFGGRSFGSACH